MKLRFAAMMVAAVLLLNPSNSLTLTVFSPDGTHSTFRDSSDGRVDGKIVLRIDKASSGVWYFKVYGEKVSGTQYYSLTIT